MPEKIRNNSAIQHQYFKVSKWKKLTKFKNIFLFAVYLAAVVIIVEFADETKILKANAKNLMLKHIEGENYEIISEMNLSMEDKLELKFYEEYIGNKDIAKYTFKHSKKYDIESSLLIALMKVESRFNNYAINYNTNRSIDRGLCQLNSSVFVDLKPEDFFNPDINISNGANHLRWCLDKANNKLTKGLAMYNAGFGKVANTRVGEMTLDYIQKIVDEKEIIDEKLEKYLTEYSDLIN